MVLTEQADGSVWAIGTTRSGESIEHGLCRQLSTDRPDLASRIGCPAVKGGGAEAPTAEETAKASGAAGSRASASRTRAAENETTGRRT